MAFNTEKLQKYAWSGSQTDPANQRAYFEFLRAQLGEPTEAEWYQIRRAQFKATGGLSMLLHYFGGSILRFLQTMLPEVAWRPWSLGSVPEGYWKSSENRAAYMRFLEDRLKIKQPEQWYEVTAAQFRKNDGAGFLMYFKNSPVLAIVDFIPNYKWEPEKFVKGKKTQKRLYSLVCRIFCPENEEIKLTIYDVAFDHKHETLRFRESGRRMEIDIFVPAIDLAFEYQGEQHYVPVECWGGEEALKEVQSRDAEKAARCRRANIILVTVPYTWTGDAAVFMQYLDNALKERDEVRRNARPNIPLTLIRPKRASTPPRDLPSEELTTNLEDNEPLTPASDQSP